MPPPKKKFIGRIFYVIPDPEVPGHKRVKWSSYYANTETTTIFPGNKSDKSIRQAVKKLMRHSPPAALGEDVFEEPAK